MARNINYKTAVPVLFAAFIILAVVIMLQTDTFRYWYADDGSKTRSVYEVTAGNQNVAYAKNKKDAEKIIGLLTKEIEEKTRAEISSSNLKKHRVKLELFDHRKIPSVETSVEKADYKNIKANSVFTEKDIKYYSTIEEESSDYKKGVKSVLSLGETGLVKNTYSIDIENCEVKDTKLINSEIIEKPVDEVVLVGTAKENKHMNDSGGNIADVSEVAQKADSMQYIPCKETKNIEQSEIYKRIQNAAKWNGTVISKSRGAISDGPHGRETYYNLNMSGVVSIMRSMGNNDPYWVRSDGVKMLGYYVMVAANFDIHPRGSIVQASVGASIVADTGSFRHKHPKALDIATNW